MPPRTMEERMTELEKQVASLLKGKEEVTATASWLDKWAGAFADDPYFEEAARLGVEYRRSQPTGAEAWDAMQAERSKAKKNGADTLPV